MTKAKPGPKPALPENADNAVVSFCRDFCGGDRYLCAERLAMNRQSLDRIIRGDRAMTSQTLKIIELYSKIDALEKILKNK